MAVTESVKIVFEVDDKALVSTVQQLQAVGKVSQEDAAKFNALSQASKAAGASLDGASKGAEKFAVASKDVAKSTTEVAKSAGELKNIGPSLAQAGQAGTQAGEGFVSLRQRLAEAKLEVQRLGEEFNNSGPEFEAAVQRAGELADEFDDLNRQVRLSNPEGKIQAFQNLGQGIVGAFQTATGALQAFGVQNEEVQQIAQRLQGALNIAQGIQSIVGLKEAYDDVKVVLGFTTAAQNTLTVATEAGTVATEGASLATKGFAASLSATGIGAIVVAIGALVGAFLLYSSSTKEAKADEEALKAAQDASKTSTDNLKDATDKLAVARGQKTQEQVDKENALNASLKRQEELSKTLGNAISEQLNAQKELDKLSKTAAPPKLREERELRLANAKAAVAQAAGAIQAEKDALAATNAYIDLNKQQKDGADAATKAEKDRADAERKGNEEKQRKIKLIDEEIAALEEAQRGALIGVDDEIQRIAITDSFRKKITDKQVERAKVAGESITLIEQKAANDQKQSFEDLVAANEATRDKDVSDAEKAAADKLAAEKKLFDEKKTLLGQEEALALLRNQVTATDATDLAEKNFNTQKEFLEKRIALETEGSNEQKRLLLELALLKKKYEKEGTDITEQELAKQNQARSEAIDFAKGLFEIGLDAQVEANQRAFDEESAALEDQKEKGIISEEVYQQRLKKLKQKQAEDNKKAAIFQATLDLGAALINALTFKPVNAVPAALIFATITAAANLAKIAATPIPKFKKGTLSVPGYDTGDDSVHAMLRPGEAVIPTEINREYASAIKAIYTRKVSAKDLNEFVAGRMSVVKDEPVFNFNPVTMDALFKRDLRVSQISSAVQRSSGSSMQTINVKANVDTYALSKAMSKNKQMELSNPDIVAKALAQELAKLNNIRRR